MDAPTWQQRLFALGDLTPEERAKASNLILAMPPEDRLLAVPEDAAMATLCVRDRLRRVEGPPGVRFVVVKKSKMLDGRVLVHKPQAVAGPFSYSAAAGALGCWFTPKRIYINERMFPRPENLYEPLQLDDNAGVDAEHALVLRAEGLFGIMDWHAARLQAVYDSVFTSTSMKVKEA